MPVLPTGVALGSTTGFYEQARVDAGLAFGREQVALDAAAGGDIGFATDEAGLGVVWLGPAVKDGAILSGLSP